MKINLGQIDFETIIYSHCEDYDEVKLTGAMWAEIAFKVKNDIPLSISQSNELEKLHGLILVKAFDKGVEFE